MVFSSKQSGRPATNQRSINEGIRKVIGSSNRGFASMDPERQKVSAPQVREAPAKGDSSGGAAAVESTRAMYEGGSGVTQCPR